MREEETVKQYDVPLREYRMLAATTEVDYPYFPFRISIDFVLVHNAAESRSKGKYREFFEKAVQKEGLIIRHQQSGQTHFTLISTPFHRLTREAEMSQMCFPLKDCQVKPGLPSCCIPLSQIFVTDDTVRFINAPFQRKHGSLFLNYHDEKSFFTSSQRGYLTYQILTKIDISKDLKGERLGESQDEPTDPSTSSITSDEQLRRKGLSWLLMSDVYEEAFVLHAPSKEEPYFKAMQNGSVKAYNEFISEIELDPRRSLSLNWERWYKFQPLNKIRDYFGEQIAYYFAWQGTFLTLLWPAVIFGLVVFIYGFIDSISSAPLDWNHCKVVNFIGQTENVACGMRNGVTLFFSMVTQWFMSSFDTKMNAFFAVFMSIWGSVFVQIWKRNNSVLSYQWNSDDFHAIEPDRPEFRGSKVKEDPITGEDIWISPALARYIKMLASFVFVSFSMLVVVISLMLVTLLKIWMVYNFQCTKEYTFHCWLSAAFLPSILNTLSAMGLGAIYSNLVSRLNSWENHRTESEHNNSLIVKIFAFQMVNTYTSLFYVAFIRPESHGLQPNGLFGLGTEFKDTCLDDTCSSLLALQLLTHTLIKPFPKFFKDVVLPYFVKLFRLRMYTSRTEARVEIEDDDQANVLVREWLKPSAGDFVLWEMNEKIILFGTTMMFASLFPLAPLLALIIGFVDMRIDAHRLIWFNRKPIPIITNGIGIWLPILTFLQYCAVFTNAFIVAFTSGFCSTFLADGAYCTVQNRLIIVIVFQNLVFGLKYLLSSVIPSIPASIKLALRKKRYVVAHIVEKGDVPHRTRIKKRTRIAKLAWIASNQKMIKSNRKKEKSNKKQLLAEVEEI
ncbi:Anoctamin [Caenorhabditis elegans]|uniref:Anoctamin n=2 Tax=Caenorhabditis elegans TaxID=6239 RepID=G5EBW3_CAEEL|nr:Anoctamin [Caenorhabditis elegans]CAX51677.2 Anoctamin [Caenorhabditis elegans]|eukprot:NP_001255190.1 Anoctamin [Caenorhabditis elegans]